MTNELKPMNKDEISDTISSEYELFTTLNGNIVKLLKDDIHTSWIKSCKHLDHNQYHLQKVLPYIKGTVIDCGAHIGTHTVFYAKYADKVIAIEPNELTFECLQHNVGYISNVELMNLGVSNIEGYIKLTQVPTNAGMAFASDASKRTKNSIKVITIDSLELDNVCYIKADIEGYEKNMLIGALKTIEKCKPILDIEVNDHCLERLGLTDKDIYNFIEDIGYEIIDRIGKKPQVDIICKYKG